MVEPPVADGGELGVLGEERPTLTEQRARGVEHPLCQPAFHVRGVCRHVLAHELARVGGCPAEDGEHRERHRRLILQAPEGRCGAVVEGVDDKLQTCSTA